MQAHGVVVDAAGGIEDALEGVGETFGAQHGGLLVAFGLKDLGLAAALGLKDGGLFLALGHGDVGLARALSFQDDGAAHALGRHLAVHRILDLARWINLADFDVRDLDAPALGLRIQFDADGLVDALALREHLVQRDVADYRPQRGGGEADDGLVIVLDFQHGAFGLIQVHAHVDEEVNLDGRVIAGDVGLARDVQHLGAGVEARDLVNDRDGEDDAGAEHSFEASEAEPGEALVVADEVDDGHLCLPGYALGGGSVAPGRSGSGSSSAGLTISVVPSTAVTSTA